MMRSLFPLAFLAFVACSSSSSSNTTPADTSAGDAADTLVACVDEEKAFDAYVAAHSSCTVDSECTILLGGGSCDCVDWFGTPGGTPIRADAVDGANAIMAVPCSGASGGSACDVAPTRDPVCNHGKCTGTRHSCMEPFDASPDTNEASIDADETSSEASTDATSLDATDAP